MDSASHGEERSRRVAFATIRRAGQASFLEETLLDDIKKALDPACKVDRYHRTWRVSKMRNIDGLEYHGGKLGFSSMKPSEQVTFDEKQGDFVSHVSQSEQCDFSHFVLYVREHANDAWIVFEERPPIIRRQSFMGALQGLLNLGGVELKVSVDREPVTFSDWLRRVDRVTTFKGKAHVPNPQWQGRVKELEAFMTESRAETVEIVAAAAPSGPGLAVDESLLGAFVGHAESRDGKYGGYSATGETEGDKVAYNNGMSDAVDHVPETLDDDSDSIWNKLMSKMIQVAGRRQQRRTKEAPANLTEEGD